MFYQREFRWGASLGLVAGALLTFLFFFSSSLLSSRRNFSYRFEPSRNLNATSSVAELEARVAAQPSAFNFSDLAALYFQQSQVSGDLSWLDKAERAAIQSLKKLSTPNPATLTLARVADARHQFPEAIRLAEKSMHEKASTGALAVLVSANLALGNTFEAAFHADRAVELRPDSQAYSMRALVLAAQGRDVEAEYDFQRAVKVEDLGATEEAARLRALWGRFLMRHGDYREAERLYQEALRILPGHHLTLSLFGELDLRRNRPRAASEHFLAAFTAQKQVRYLHRYAHAKRLEGNLAMAEELSTQAERTLRRELNENATGHRLDLVELLLDRGTPEGAKEAVELAREELRHRRSSDVHYLLAKALLVAGRVEEAHGAMRAALRSGVQINEYLELAAAIEKRRGNIERATFYAEGFRRPR